MQINAINNQTNFNGIGNLFGKKACNRNVIIRPKIKPRETVVVLPDGTIERGKLAKVRQFIDDIIGNILERIFS